MEQEPSETTYSVTVTSRRRAILLGLAGAALTTLVWAVLYQSAVLAVVLGLVAIVTFVQGIVPVETRVLRLAEDGVYLYEKGSDRTRFLSWSNLSGVTAGKVPDQNGRGREMLVFRLKALEWRYVLPVGSPAAEELAAAIRLRIRPEVAERTDSLDARAFFETVFSIRIPDTVKVLHEEFHSSDKSGLWSVRIGKDEFMKLKTTAGAVSEWFPLTCDQRFEVGGRRLVGTQDIRGEYAISRQDWDSTPVLVWDAADGVLHGMLTRSVA
jgi:hypothetical protein